jgi:peptidoglycan/xylan/chitin deacetylase (PgdA/CDA1 family)
VFFLVPLMMLVGIVLSPLIITALIKLDSKSPIFKSKTLSTSKNTTEVVAFNESTNSRTLGKATQTTTPQQIMPESGDSSRLFANQFLQSIPPPTTDCQAAACVALTFDDGPNADSTKLLLDTFSAHLAHATFFEIGIKVAGKEDLLRRMQQEGHDIGNHSWSHPSFLKLKPEEIQQQVQKTQQTIQAAGVPAPHLFRPPYEDFLLSMQKDIKLPVILWNVDPKDWAEKDPQKIATTIEQQIKPGAIMVMHDRLPTAQAIDKVLSDLKDKYKFVTISKLLNLQPDSQGVYVGR